MASKKTRVCAVVPKVVFTKVFVGVVPACVTMSLAAACSNNGTTCTGPGCGRQYGVAAVAYACFDGGKPVPCYGVAAVAYQCFDAGRPVPCYGGVADAAFRDSEGDAPSDANRDGDAPSDGSDSG